MLTGKKLEQKFNVKVKAKKTPPPKPEKKVLREVVVKNEKPSVVTPLKDLKVLQGQPLILKAQFKGI